MARSAAIDLASSEERGYLKRVQDIIGVSRLRSDQDVVKLVEARLPVDAIDGLLRSGLTGDEIYSLVLPRRTLTHRRTRGGALSRDESDRAVRIARIIARGEHVFGDRERFWRWFRAEKRQLQRRTPVQLVATEAGARLVEEWLIRIDEGMAA